MQTYIKHISILGLILLLSFFLLQSIESELLNLVQTAKQNESQFAMLSFFILSSDVVLPIPSSIIMYLNGNVLGIAIGSLLSAGALTIGSILGYGLGRAGYFIKKVDNKAKAYFEEKGMYSIALSKGIPILSESIAILAGYYKYSFKKYLAVSMIGILPIAIIYAILGWLAVNKFGFIASFLVILVVGYILYLKGRSFSAKSK